MFFFWQAPSFKTNKEDREVGAVKQEEVVMEAGFKNVNHQVQYQGRKLLRNE